MDESKTCPTCGETKAVSDFGTPKSKSPHCRACRSAANRAWREANKERVATRKRKYHRENAEARRAYQEQWRKANLERVAAYNREQRLLQPGKEASARRAHRAKNAEHIREVERLRREKNLDKVRAQRRARYEANIEANRKIAIEVSARRRAQKLGTPVGDIDLGELWTGSCGICEMPIDEHLTYPDLMRKSIDHVVPLAKGGPHIQSNLQWAHLLCNIRKGARLPD